MIIRLVWNSLWVRVSSHNSTWQMFQCYNTNYHYWEISLSEPKFRIETRKDLIHTLEYVNFEHRRKYFVSSIIEGISLVQNFEVLLVFRESFPVRIRRVIYLGKSNTSIQRVDVPCITGRLTPKLVFRYITNELFSRSSSTGVPTRQSTHYISTWIREGPLRGGRYRTMQK